MAEDAECGCCQFKRIVNLEMFGLFNQKPPLEAEVAEWLVAHFAWALDHFDSQIFFNDTQLVLPNNRFFPGRAENVEQMADLVFTQVKKLAGITHWPTELLDQASCSLQPPGAVEIRGALRGAGGEAAEPDAPRLLIPYNPQQINNPEGLIASFAHVIAQHLGPMANEAPPSGAEDWPEITELLAT